MSLLGRSADQAFSPEMAIAVGYPAMEKER